MFNKPTGFASPFAAGGSTASTPGFGTGFGTTTQTASGGLFGQTNTQQPSTGLFGGNTPAFGSQPSSGFSFGSTPASAPAGGLFAQKPAATASLFGTPTPAANTSSTFGFGSSGGFGTTTSTANTAGLFGAAANTSGGLFGASAGGFGQQQQQQNGTSIKFNPLTGQDTMVKNGQTQTINTKHQCITAMKEYETKSLEELRVEDYISGRKGKQAGTSGFGFAAPATTTGQTAGFFTQTAKPAAFTSGFGTSTAGSTGGLFGQTATQPSTGGLFGQSKPGGLFGTPTAATTTQPSGFGFGTNTSTGTGGLFGNTQQNKPLFGTATTQSTGLFGTSTSTFGQPAASTGFGGFGTAAPATGGLFGGNKPAFGTAATTVSSGFGFGGSNTGANLFAKPFSAQSAGFGFNTAPTQASAFGATQPFGASKPAFGGLTTSTAAPAFSLGGNLNTGTSLFGGSTLNKPSGFGIGGTTGFAGFGATTGLGQQQTLGGQASQAAVNPSIQIQQTLMALANSPYGDSKLFSNMPETSIKREDILKPTNPAAQKAILANRHKVTPRPMAKIKPKALSGNMNSSKSHIFEGLDEDDFSFGNDTFQPRKSVKKLTLKKGGQDSTTPSRASSVSGEPANISALRDEEQFRGRSSPIAYQEERPDSRNMGALPETENIIRSKGISDQLPDTPNRSDMDDTIALLNARNKSGPTIEPPVIQQQSPNESVNISIISRDESNNEDDIVNERPMTPPPHHPAGIVLMRPGYYTIPSFEALAELVDEDGNCYVEDLTIGREGYGSIFFPGITNITDMNFDEIVFFRRKEVIVYPDDDNKPPEGEGLNKKAEITLDCVWPRDKSLGTPIKSPEKLQAMKWQDKIEANSLKVGARFKDYRPETGSWVFEVKHFSKYGLVDDSDDEGEISEQEKKRLRTAQSQQVNVQKQKLRLEQQTAQAGAGLKPPVVGIKSRADGSLARFTIGTDDEESEGSGAGGRVEVPMGDDEQIVDLAAQRRAPAAGIEGEDEMEMIDEQPSSHRLATSMGVDARSMQVMKASFFMDEDAPAPAFDGSMFGKKSAPPTGSPLLRGREGSGPSLFSSTLKAKYMTPVKLGNLPKETVPEAGLYSPRLITPEPIRASSYRQEPLQPPVKEYMLLESGMSQHDYQKRALGSRVTKVIPTVTESVMYNKQALLVDAGLFMGRSFRVGWGPGWTLAHCGDPVQPREEEEERPAGTFNLFTGGQRRPASKANKAWTVHLQKVNVADHINPRDKTVIQNHCEMLEIQLVHSRSSLEGECPVFAPTPGVEALHQYAERNQEELKNLSGHQDEDSVQHMGMVWDLCVALWGNLPEFKDLEVGKDSYLYHNARREAFSQWLADVSAGSISTEVQQNKYKENGQLVSVLSAMTGRQIVEACQLAQNAGNPRLALLLAQSISNYMPRQMISKQLEEYIELGANNFINETLLKVYSLLAGQLVLTCSGMTVNTCEGLDWKRALALHLWYCCQADAPIQEAVEIYDRSFTGTGDYSSYCCAPLPPYLEQEGLELDREGPIWDTCYHLLSLYCRRSHPLENLLNPVTSTPSQLDYRLSWHLGQVMESLSFRHLSSYQRASLHMNFASHLESLGLWEWAVFVALHIDNSVSRENVVHGLLCRHVQLEGGESYMEREELLRGKLHVPTEWIHSAKALRASYENRPREEARHLLRAGQWNRSHLVLLRHIAADDIIHENHDSLRESLVELSAPARCASILDWHTGGKVLLDYINICDGIKLLSQIGGDRQLYELDQLLPEVQALCTKVGSLPCRTSKDRLCQSEMAKKAANFLRLILTLQAEARGQPHPSVRSMAPYISNLPMPEDYVLHELHSLTRAYMMEQAVA
ncbi:nuclear pore complex protein Nup98-Nup96-like [Mya arenaria]|uniref:nuclear pore complex protein Nup98-Nup96-like n=1 Tax=Mya arenaria TaxID=6604 RepID=UPI0022E5F284|nr:nuclear pore complex protein Nup98-Nup96-like [Mya arenaria]XP_052793616.1 nuclear pore complex protein Nup98-Nup96-like [Mya arenaria]XP_052793617.1 nuclear pore complex protein Nup98-Nup96-like [Mya arenaria]